MPPNPKKSPPSPKGGVTFKVSTESRPGFDEALVAFAFDREGALLDSAPVRSGEVALDVPKERIASARVFLAPQAAELKQEELSPARLERLGAYEPVLRAGGLADLIDTIVIPGNFIDRWPFCFCWVRGRVVRSSDGRPVCDAVVHVCEVDRVPRWIFQLPEPDVLRLRDDLLEVLRNPPFPPPRQPIPFPEPIPPAPGPNPDPFRIDSPLFRTAGAKLTEPTTVAGFNPQPEPPASLRSLRTNISLEAQCAEPISGHLLRALSSPSNPVVRATLAENWRLIVPWFCIWPWWRWRFRCDEVAVRTTDAHGRFEALVVYPCGGDRPDLYFWVEFDLGGGLETVHRPPIACNTHWDYPCGTDVTIHVSDPRVPACDAEGDLAGCQVVVRSIGVGLAVRELRTAASGPTEEGLTTAGRPLGGTLEPRVDFSRTCLIDTKEIPYYRWSYRRLSGPDGATPQVGSWTVLTRSVYRHYKLGTSYPSDPMGPMPTSGPEAAPLPNLFRIRPLDPPAGDEWVVLNEHVDLATGYFETASLSGAPTTSPSAGSPAPDDLAAGRYELKLELFDKDGNRVNWTAEGIDLRITEQDAPFGTGTVTTEPAPAYNRVQSPTGDTLGFRMVVRVDNNRCYAEILPVAGDIPPDPDCGFHEYASVTDDAQLAFVARHPNRFATYGFSTRRGTGPAIGEALSSGVAGDPGTNGFLHVGGFTYRKDVSVGTLLGSCDQAAFSEHLQVNPTATDGYTILTGYRHTDVAAFALAQPCDPCECEEGSAGGGPGRGGGQGRGGQGGGPAPGPPG